MQWILNYQLFLFDLDGLLVNTEELHFRAYQQMCIGRGFELPWDFATYCQAAHYDNTRLRDRIYASLPDLQKQEPKWEILYAEKKKALNELLHNHPPEMMPGATSLLKALEEKHLKRCVCTHSPDDVVEIIRKHNPILDTIPFWITRHDYTHAKPDPECYQLAIDRLKQPGENVVGFEDTPRGLKALMQTEATATLITKVPYPEISEFVSKGAYLVDSLLELEKVL